MPKFEKGSQEAKDYMASMRAKRGTKAKGGALSNPSVALPDPPRISRPPVRIRPNLTINTNIDPRITRIVEINELLQVMELTQEQIQALRTERNDLEDQLRGNPQGGGLVKDTVKKIKKGSKKIGEYVEAVVKGRGDMYPPKVRKLLKRFGDMKVVSAEIRRSPVQSVLTNAMNVLTFGKFKKNMEKTPYDRLFHLQLVFTLDNQQQLLVEKNEVINMDLVKGAVGKSTEVLAVTPFTSLTLNEALEKTRASMTSKFFDYNAENNNCQDFIMGILKSNGWGNASNFEFVKQDTKKLFKGLSGLAKTAYTLTELGERVNVAITGKGSEIK